jgi:hypothetical protein
MLRGVDDTAVTVTKEAAGPLLTVSGNGGAGDTPHLILENITLRGYSANDSSLVVAGEGSGKRGTLTMKAGSRITGNTANGNAYISPGGGVSVKAGSAFFMAGGSIDANRVKEARWTLYGGGVHNSGTFEMSGGSIDNNTVENEQEGGQSYGGGVYGAASGIFTMSGGSIENNSCITKSEGRTYGGGVDGGNFTMTGTARIAGNSAARGGGIAVGMGFTMEGGTIQGNTATEFGAGVYVPKNSTFTKTGGVIYGTDAGGDSNKAAAGTGTVHAMEITQPGYYASEILTKYYRDTTAWDDVDLSSGSDAGWEQ